MYQIDNTILNKALRHPGLLKNNWQYEFCQRIDEVRQRNPYVRLTRKERQVLKEIGRRPGIDIYPEEYGPTAEVRPMRDPVAIHGLQDRERDIDQALQAR